MKLMKLKTRRKFDPSNDFLINFYEDLRIESTFRSVSSSVSYGEEEKKRRREEERRERGKRRETTTTTTTTTATRTMSLVASGPDSSCLKILYETMETQPWLFPTSREQRQRQRHNDDDDNDDENDDNDEDEDEDEDEKRLAHSGDPFSTSSARVTTASCGSYSPRSKKDKKN
uniref:transcription initiation factor TFIID subunit 11-like isoform X1 n=1 Tax=Vespula vulgaris TaxID=7454 RepID=UPI00223B0AAA|nr:transcription initiation factor TFIID subunit 11-like isoform X1 [Vespula vulgaris]